MPQRRQRLEVSIRRRKGSSDSRFVQADLIGIGVDLLALDRARSLLKRHGSLFFYRILSPREKKQKLKITPILLAKYFTAKEAFFKSSGLGWTDLQGFSGMWIRSMRGNFFEMECTNPKIKGQGHFFTKGQTWGAKVQAWKN